ncbi:MAG: three-Cys-motif partner protein TcmP [Phycisphaerae bacterium]
MTPHNFGGEWTREKLERVRKYLCAYTRIFTVNPRARFYRTIYVDAFAGTGRVDIRSQSDSPGVFAPADTDAVAFLQGSAQIALEVEPPFDSYLFVEKSSKHVGALQELRDQFPARRSAIEIIPNDANITLQRWCEKTDWRSHRAVVFLDPYGMQVDWNTIKAIAATRAIDLWFLFPLGVAVMRLLTNSGPPPKPWADALSRIFGDESWRDAFYPAVKEATLFGTENIERRDVAWEKLKTYFIGRLRSVFAGVADNPLQLCKQSNSPIYLLCFAAGNSRGARIAVRIAQDILAPKG